MTANEGSRLPNSATTANPTESEAKTARIRELNDQLRSRNQGGRCYVTPGILGLSPLAQFTLRQKVAAYAGFTPDNDPYGEHDFGSLTIEGELIFWKIDYYDVDLQCGSPDPSDPTVTVRVLTIMLASEY